VTHSFEEIFVENTIKTNRRFMYLIFFSNAAAPLIAVGTWLKFFQISYTSCMEIFITTVVISHFIWWLNHHKEWHEFTKFIGLLMVEILIMRLAMNASIGIYISYAFIPLFSCLYVDQMLTIIMNLIGYFALAASLYFRSFDLIAKYGSIFTARQWFLSYLMGFTIEFVFLFAITLSIVKYERELLKSLSGHIVRQVEAEQTSMVRTKFFAKLSHELRTPLNAICGLTDLLKEKDLEEESQKYVETIDTSSKAMLEIVNSLLDISKIYTDKMTIQKGPVDLRALTEDTIRLASFSVEKKIPIKLELDRSLPKYIVGDRTAFTRILLNLLNNALKYTDEGKITVRILWKDKEEDAGILHLEVEDTGRGIAPSDLDRIFEEYAQTADAERIKYTGTGLGLAVCRNYVELLEGRIWAKSGVGIGSVFYVEIPTVSTEEAPKEKTKEKFKPSFQAPEARVLIVDDKRTNIQVLAELLKPYRMKLSPCLSGEQAVELIKSGRHFDLVFMDYYMPGIDGREATKQIHELEKDKGKKTVVVALSANPAEIICKEFEDTEIAGALQKPVNREDLDAVLEQCIDASLRSE